MKRHIFILILALMISLTSCMRTPQNNHTSHSLSTEQEEFSSVPSTSNAETENTTLSSAEDSEILSSVRYVPSYHVTDMQIQYPDLPLMTGQFYSHSGLLYICGTASVDDFKLYVFDDTAVLIDTVSIPAIRSEEHALLYYAYPLEEKFIVGYQVSIDYQTTHYLAIIDAKGKIEQSTVLHHWPSEAIIRVLEHTSKFGTHSLAIWTDCLDGISRIYDLNLNESSSSVYLGKPKLVDNGWIQFGYTVDRRQLYNTKTGEIKESAMHLPSAYNSASIIVGADNNQYFCTNNGIYRYRGNEQPYMVLEYHASGMHKPGMSQQDILILNEQTIYFREYDSKTFQLYSISQIPDSDQRRVIQIDFLATENGNSTWLTDAITAFNQQNTEYRVEIDYLSNDAKYSTLQEQWQTQLNEILLYEWHPDIVILGDSRILTTHYEKNIFLDLTELLDTSPLGCVREAYGYGDALYQIPLMMTLDTFAANSEVVNEPLTYTKFFSIIENLGEGEILTDRFNTTFYQNALMDFIDPATKTAHYDTEEFRNVLRYMRMLECDTGTYTDRYAGAVNFGSTIWYNGRTYGGENQYWTVNGTAGTALENQTMKFLSVDFNSINALNAIKLLFGDTDFTLCGYPCTDGNGARIYTPMASAVLWDTDVPDGCAVFLDFLLSDEMQTKNGLLENALPVTSSAMAKAIDLHRYSYYTKSTIQTIFERNTPDYINLTPVGVSEFYNERFNGSAATEENYTVLEITSDEKQMLLDFFETAHMRADTDPFVKTIIDEEVSFWESNTRSLEETTKIIQSRVWIYINE